MQTNPSSQMFVVERKYNLDKQQNLSSSFSKFHKNQAFEHSAFTSLVPKNDDISSKDKNEHLQGDRQFQEQLIQNLLELESKWIVKQCQIKDYVQSLKKTIEEKDLKIEKLHIDNYKLTQKLEKIQQEKDNVLIKLNQIHETMNVLKSQKLKTYQKVQIKKQLDSRQLLCQKQLINQTYKPSIKIQQKNFVQKIQSYEPSQIKQKHRKEVSCQLQNDSNGMQSRIMSNLVKMFEENFTFYPHNESDSSESRDDQRIFAKKGRQIRATTTTDDTTPCKMNGSVIKKNNFLTIKTEQHVEALPQLNKRKQSYKSAKTITFSREEANEQNQIEKDKFYSHNEINCPPKTYSEIQTIEKDVQQKSFQEAYNNIECSDSYKRLDSLKQKQQQYTQSKVLNMKRSICEKVNSFISLSKKQTQFIQMKKNKELSDNEVQVSGQARKRRKSKKRTTNIDYSLSDSLISESDVQQNRHQERHESIFKPLTHQKASKEKAAVNQILPKQKGHNKLSKFSTFSIELGSFKADKDHSELEEDISNVDNQLHEVLHEQYATQMVLQQDETTKNTSNKLDREEQKRQPIKTEQNKLVENKKRNNLEIKRQEIDQTLKVACPETVKHTNKKPTLIQRNAFDIKLSTENKPEIKQINHLSKLSQKVCQVKVETQKEKSDFSQNTIQKNEPLEGTNQKKPQFSQSGDLQCTSVKNHRERLDVPYQKSRLFINEGAPETKCTSFQDKSFGNSFYFDKTFSHSDGPIRKLKFSPQNLQNSEQNNKMNKILFQNQMLKSYNNTLQKQTKKMSKTDKLMERFNSQNASILNKLNKKSIS